MCSVLPLHSCKDVAYTSEIKQKCLAKSTIDPLSHDRFLTHLFSPEHFGIQLLGSLSDVFKSTLISSLPCEQACPPDIREKTSKNSVGVQNHSHVLAFDKQCIQDQRDNLI